MQQWQYSELSRKKLLGVGRPFLLPGYTFLYKMKAKRAGEVGRGDGHPEVNS